MTGFDIRFTGDRADDDPEVAIGVMYLVDHTEGFHAPTTYWSTDQYESSWNTALRRTIDGAEVSCLVVAIDDPRADNFTEVWPIYRENDTVYFQNHYLFPENLDHEFDPDVPWDSVRARETINDDGDKLSEWELPLQSLRDFLRQRNLGSVIK